MGVQSIAWRRAASRCSLFVLVAACGAVSVQQVGILSVGNLDGRVVPEVVQGDRVAGRDCSQIAGDAHSLAKATRNALEGSDADTLVEATVTVETGVLVMSNCIEVQGTAVRSDSFPLARTGGRE